MDLAALIPLAFKASILLIVFGLGLKATIKDVTYLFRQPRKLLRSLLALNVILPLLAAALAAAFNLHPAVKVALVLLAVSPVPPMLPGKLLKLHGRRPYVYGLLETVAVLSIVLVPVTIALVGLAFGREVNVPPGLVARVVMGSVLVPLAAGLLVQRLAPTLAERIEPVVSQLGFVVLMLAAIPVVFVVWPAMTSLIGSGAIVAFATLAFAGLLVGHLLGGPEDDDRTVLALAGVSRHPGVALAIATATFPALTLVPAAIVMYLLVSAVVTIPYVTSRKHRQARLAAARG